MKIINRNLNNFAVAALAALVGLAAATAFGQEKVRKVVDKAELKEKVKGFCNTGWSNSKQHSVTELREITLPAAGMITVDGGRNGGVSVIGEDRGDILVRACIQAWRPTEADAKAAAASVKIATSGAIKAESDSGDKDFAVSYQVLVPRSTSLNLMAKNGGISINGVNGNAEFETVNGGLNIVDASGNVRGRTANGGVNVRLSGTGWKGSGLDVQTTNGGVNLTMPENYSANIETGTVNGGFNSEIRGLESEPEDRYGRRKPTRIKTTLNGGGAPVRVITTNGGVRIVTMESPQ
jgi:hypothetical protein